MVSMVTSSPLAMVWIGFNLAEETPVAGFGAGMQMVMSHDEPFVGRLFLLRVMDTRVKPAYDGVLNTSREFDVVLCALQDARRVAVADQFPDRARHRRAGAEFHPLCIAWAQAGFCEHRATGILRVLAAGKLAALPAGTAISSVGCEPGRAGRHCRAGRCDRSRCFRRTRRAGICQCGRSDRRHRRPCPSLPEGAHSLFRRQRQSGFRRYGEGSRLRDGGVREFLEFPGTA